MKKKILLIAGYYPPVNISSGALRPWFLKKYLERVNWSVSVMTPAIDFWLEKHIENGLVADFNDNNVIYTDLSNKFLAPDKFKTNNGFFSWFFGGIARRLFRFFQITNWYGWKKPAIKYAQSHQELRDFDLVIATGEPFIGFRIARSISGMYGIPYVLDYRDPWTGEKNGKFNRRWIKNLERSLITNAKAVIVAHPSIKTYLAKNYGFADKIFVITNGYDPEEYIHPKSSSQKEFLILYSGILNPQQHSLLPIFKALKLLENNYQKLTKWKFLYAGNNSDIAIREASEAGIIENFENLGKISRSNLLQINQNISLGIVLGFKDNEFGGVTRGAIPAKIFQLIHGHIPTLVISPQGSDVNEIVDISGGMKYFLPGDISGIAKYIIDCMNGKIPPQNHPEEFSWKNLSKRYVDILSYVLEQKE